MVKRLKAIAENASRDSDLAAAVKASAQQIWLAGLGAFAKAQEEGQKVFESLVKEGSSLHKRTVKMTEQTVGEAGERVGKMAGEFQKQANGTWDKLEGVFEERVARALSRLGVPSKKEIAELNDRIEELTSSVDRLAGGKSMKSSAAKKRPSRPRKAAKRTASAA